MQPPDFLYDDAYITLASAQALWTGVDSHYPTVSPLAGVTSPFHVLLVALLVRLMTPGWALLLSCALGAGVYAAGLWRLAHRCPTAERALFLIAGLGTGSISQHLLNGLETSWAMAGVTWLLVLSNEERPRALGLVAGLLPFVRPELGIIAVLFVLLESRRSIRQAVDAAVAALAVGLPGVALLWVSCGSVIPTSLAAKSDWFAETCWTWSQRAVVVGDGLRIWLGWNLPACAGLVAVVRSVKVRVGVLAGALTVFLWSLNVPSVLDNYHRGRYLAPFTIVLLAGLPLLPNRVRRPLLAGAAVLALFTIGAVARLEPRAIALASAARAQEVDALRAWGARRVLLHDAGYLAWANAAPEMIDMVGLKSRVAADENALWSGPTCGGRRSQAIQAVARQTRPDFLLIWEPWDEHFGVTHALVADRWRVTLVETVHASEPIYLYRLSRQD